MNNIQIMPRKKRSIPSDDKQTIIDRIILMMEKTGITKAELGRRTGVTRSAIGKMLKEKPTSIDTDKLLLFANAFHCDPIWLQYGDEYQTDHPVGKVLQFNGNNLTLKEVAIGHTRSTISELLIKEITWKEAPFWRGIMHSVKEDKTRTEVFVNKDTNPDSFALPIINDVMTAPKGAQYTFNIGEQIIVDPDIKPQSGSFVVVFFPQTKETILREYSVDGNTIYLKPLNSAYPIIKGAEDMHICGVVVKVVATRYIGH